jgi:hypothetical protein
MSEDMTYLALMRPHITQLVEHFDLSKWTEHALHEPRLAYGFLHTIEARIDNAFCANNTSNTTSNPSDRIEAASHHFLTCGSCVSYRFH